jgi:hypothetical protein
VPDRSTTAWSSRPTDRGRRRNAVDGARGTGTAGAGTARRRPRPDSRGRVPDPTVARQRSPPCSRTRTRSGIAHPARKRKWKRWRVTAARTTAEATSRRRDGTADRSLETTNPCRRPSPAPPQRLPSGRQSADVNATGTVRACYDARRGGDPLGPQFADGEPTVNYGVSGRLVGLDAVRAGPAAQTGTTTDRTVESRALRVTERTDHAWFGDDVRPAWTEVEPGVRTTRRGGAGRSSGRAARRRTGRGGSWRRT